MDRVSVTLPIWRPERLVRRGACQLGERIEASEFEKPEKLWTVEALIDLAWRSL